jgi:hypothetical protein
MITVVLPKIVTDEVCSQHGMTDTEQTFKRILYSPIYQYLLLTYMTINGVAVPKTRLNNKIAVSVVIPVMLRSKLYKPKDTPSAKLLFS